jgi:hypothetical protein
MKRTRRIGKFARDFSAAPASGAACTKALLPTRDPFRARYES